MEEIMQRNTTIKRGARLAFLFVVFAMGVSQILIMLLPFLPSRICEIIGMIIGTVVVLAGSGRKVKSLFAEEQKLTGTGCIVLIGAFMAAKLLSLIPSVALAQLFVNEENAGTLQELSSTVDENLLLSFLFLGIVTPICEEAVFRGCIGSTYKKYGVWFAMLMSTIFFSLYHCNVLQLVSTFLPGIVLFYAAMKYSLKWSVLLHFINNGVLSVGFIALKKVLPEGAFIANYGEYIIEAVLVIAALCLLKKDRAIEKVKAFLGEPANEKGVYKAAMGNIWFILLAAALILVSVMMLLMLSGNLPSVPTMTE